MKSFKFRFLRRVKVWHLLYILAIVIVYFILTSSREKEKPTRKAPELHAPKVNALLSTGLAKLRGNTFHDVGEILDHLAMEDVSCVPFKATHRKVKICIYDLARDEVVSKSLKMYETWESDQLHDFETILNRDKELGLLDLGANLGVFTLTAAAMGRKVLAVDACHSTVSRLKKSIYINRFLDKVSLVEAALSTVRGYSFMFVPAKNAAGAYPHQIPREFITVKDVKNHRVVKNVFLDDLLKFIDVNKAVIRIDIGGKEPMVLAGSRLFEIIHIESIFMTYTYSENQRKPIQIALEELEIKGFVPKRSRMDLHPLDIGDFEKWPSKIIWLRRQS